MIPTDLNIERAKALPTAEYPEDIPGGADCCFICHGSIPGGMSESVLMRYRDAAYVFIHNKCAIQWLINLTQSPNGHITDVAYNRLDIMTKEAP